MDEDMRTKVLITILENEARACVRGGVRCKHVHLKDLVPECDDPDNTREDCYEA